MTTEEKTTYQRLIVERRGPVGWIINNRPERLNAFNLAMWEHLDGHHHCRLLCLLHALFLQGFMRAACWHD